MNIARLPVALFGASMGLAGLASLWRVLERHWQWAPHVSWALTGLVSLLLMALSIGYFTKILQHRDKVRDEFSNPMSISFFSTAPIGTSLVAGLWAEQAPVAAGVVWSIAAAFQVTLALLTLRRWLQGGVPLQAVTPAWFIPVVGNIVLPLGGVPLGFEAVSWVVYWIGLLWWLVLFPVVFYRLVFGDPLPAPATPSLAIIVAPPAIAYLSYQALTGGVQDDLALFFISATSFIALLVLSLLGRLRAVPFGYGFWSLTFPAVAVCLGVGIISAFAALATLLIAWIGVRTLMALRAGSLY
jgi:tellurite resistance protein